MLYAITTLDWYRMRLISGNRLSNVGLSFTISLELQKGKKDPQQQGDYLLHTDSSLSGAHSPAYTTPGARKILHNPPICGDFYICYG